MESSIPFFAYKETRLDLDTSTQGTTISLRLPSVGTVAALSRTTQKRPNTTDNAIAEDENAFRHKSLATAASVYHRCHHYSPRSFLWRVLEGGKVLSVRAVDVSKQRSVGDAYLTLRLTFPQPILPSCVALSDSKEHDVLNVFVLTEGKTLWTFNFRPDHFRKPSNTEDNISDWCRSYTPNVLGIKRAHRLVALSAYELLISLHDGSLVRLYRNSGGEGFLWKEQQYNEGGWGHGIRSLISFQGSNTVRYGGHNVELSTATSMASPVTNINGASYAFAVSLDHRLRVWNLATAKIAYMSDILNQNLELQDETKKVIDPSQSQLVKVVTEGDESALCVTYSPLGAGQFKFWNVRPTIDGSLDLEDLFPDNILVPQAPTTDIWTLADFSVLLDSESVEKLTLWALWKNNVTYRLHKLDFQTGSVARARKAWNTGWEAMSFETLRDSLLPTIVSGDSSDVTDKWLEYILTPGRFSTPTLETGLAIYERGLGSRRDSVRKVGSLEERMCAAIASTAALGRTSDGTMDYDQFRLGTDTQWRRFFRLLEELDKQRGEAMSLVIDPNGRMPWVVLADGITAIRDCNGLERIWHNIDNLPAKTEIIGRPLVAAATFADVLPDNFINACRSMLLEELFQEPSVSEVDRIRALYDKCDFANQVGDEEYLQLRSNLGGNFQNLTSEVYEAIFTLMDDTVGIDRNSEEFVLAEFGNKLVVRGVREVTELHRNICFEQIILLIFVEVEINHEEDGIDFDTATAFNKLVIMLRRLELIHWLSSTQLSLPLKRTERSGSLLESNFHTKQSIPMETITILEGVYRHLFGLHLQENEAMSSVVTEILLDICSSSCSIESPPAVTQCFLLKHDRADLAMEFGRFAGTDPFATYIQGRACLAANDALAASLFFKKAAFGMSYPNPRERLNYPSASYLDETEKSLMNAGLPEYYSHIVALFDKDRNFSFVIDFARLSLQFLKPTGEVQSSHLRTEMHSRLFNAALHTTQFDIAHSTIILFKDTALQTSSLRTFITKMCETSHASQLINLPFIGLQDLVDDILLQKCQSIVDVTAGVPYHKILYSWRIKHGDFRGAAAIALDRLHKLQQSGDGDKMLGDDIFETPVTVQYVSLINALCCVDPKQAWILSEEFTQKGAGTLKPGDVNTKPKRKVVTLADVRKDYQAELDRIAAIQNNQFAFASGDQMDVL